MQQVSRQKKVELLLGYATWIAQPRLGDNRPPIDYEYVKIN
jgi:hypothetical protein